MYIFSHCEITRLFRNIYTNIETPFYFTLGFWTIVIALVIPFLVEYLRRRPYRSNLVVKDVIVINQDNDPDTYEPKLLDVARIAIKNIARFKAESVEAYIEKIVWDGEIRRDFIPMPLFWTHGQLSKSDPTIRDIYPNQTVLLDILENILDPEYVGERSVRFAVATGQNIDTLSKLNLGESELLVKIYQKSGQVNEIHLKIVWDMKSTPQVSIIR